MFEDSTIVWIPVPRERLLDAYAALATMSPVGRPIPGLPTPIKKPLPPDGSAPPRVSLAMVNRAKREIKHLPQPFTVNDLHRAMGVGRTSAYSALCTLIKEGWAKQATFRVGVKAKLYEYVPAPEAPTVKQDDPPEVTGRGSITGNGGPVAGTGREALRGNVGHLITQLRKQGWTVKKTSKSHYKAVKDHNIVILSSTPSDMRALQNMVSQLRKAGAKL